MSPAAGVGSRSSGPDPTSARPSGRGVASLVASSTSSYNCGMSRRLLTIACVLGAFACGAATTALVEPTAAHATEGQYRECFGAIRVPHEEAEKLTPSFTPDATVLVPNGWTVVGGATAGDGWTSVVLCR